jgi:hypothetical protein
MQTVRINKAKLQNIVTANRTKHATEYREAIKGYWISLEEAFEDKAQAVADHLAAMEAKERTNKQMADGPSNYLDHGSLPKPEDHLDDYDNIIAMLKWSEDETVELEAHDFSNYVLDDWGWKEQFTRMSETYNGKTPRKRRR